MRKNLLMLSLLTLVFSFPVFKPASIHAEEGKNYAGWELGSEYNDLYNPKELDKIRGEIVKFTEVTPLPGMAEGTAFYFDEGDGEPFLVHVCPTAYATATETGLRRGVKTKMRGSWAVIDDKDIFIASKIKQGEHFVFKVRLTKSGKPFWTMGKEELARELAAAE